MPKKGQRQPYKVDFVYPGQKPGRHAASRYAEAERLAGQIGRRGADVTIRLVADGVDPVELAHFGPGTFHSFFPVMLANVDHGLICHCAFKTTTVWTGAPSPTYHSEREVTNQHMVNAGLCPECWGTMGVAERTPRGTQGNLAACPFCGDTGDAAELSYQDPTTGEPIDRDAYVSRYDMLRTPVG